MPVQTKDTTGAGDAFIGSFAVFLAQGFDERDAVERANLYAALSTTSVGTQKSFVNRDAFDREWTTRSENLRPSSSTKAPGRRSSKTSRDKNP